MSPTDILRRLLAHLFDTGGLIDNQCLWCFEPQKVRVMLPKQGMTLFQKHKVNCPCYDANDA